MTVYVNDLATWYKISIAARLGSRAMRADAAEMLSDPSI
jgi:divalent metal cation (Fe/Co/Zn/Cd) transporter